MIHNSTWSVEALSCHQLVNVRHCFNLLWSKILSSSRDQIGRNQIQQVVPARTSKTCGRHRCNTISLAIHPLYLFIYDPVPEKVTKFSYTIFDQHLGALFHCREVACFSVGSLLQVSPIWLYIKLCQTQRTYRLDI